MKNIYNYNKLSKEQRKMEKENKKLIKKELNILKFMLKTDVKYHHHGKFDSMKNSIANAILHIKSKNTHEEYNSYIWNYQGEGKNYMSVALLGCLWRNNEFKTIHDVPLNGSYHFHIYDSGNRGLGTFNHMTVHKIENKPIVPYVNPGGFPPISIK